MSAVRPTMREEHPLIIALEVEIRTFMRMTATAEPGVGFGGTPTKTSCIGQLIIDEIPAALTFHDPHSSKSMFSLPWEGDE